MDNSPGTRQFLPDYPPALPDDTGIDHPRDGEVQYRAASIHDRPVYCSLLNSPLKGDTIYLQVLESLDAYVTSPYHYDPYLYAY